MKDTSTMQTALISNTTRALRVKIIARQTQEDYEASMALWGKRDARLNYAATFTNAASTINDALATRAMMGRGIAASVKANAEKGVF